MVEWRTQWRTSAPKARPTRPAMTYRAPVRALRHNENRCSVMSYDNLQTVLVRELQEFDPPRQHH
jgi:hypothetical protein